MKKSSETAIVQANGDKAGAGRIDAAVQKTDGQVYPEQFEPIFTPGWFSPPEPGDAVEVVMPEGDDLAEFAHDVRYRGQVFDESHPPPTDFKQPGPKCTRRGYFTKGGHRLIFEDFAGDESLIIREGKAGHEVKLQGSDGTITITNGKSSSKITMKANGDVEIDAGSANIDAKCATFTAVASTKAHLKAPLTDLSDVSAQPVMLGTTVLGAFTALFTAWQNALALATPPPLDPNYIAYKAAMVTAVTAVQGTLATWLSTKTKTG
jgi:hypothetical protein